MRVFTRRPAADIDSRAHTHVHAHVFGRTDGIDRTVGHAVPDPVGGAGQGGHLTSPPPAQMAQPVKSGGNLPFTGSAGRLLAALGAVHVLGGAGAMVIARRRRGRHASTSS